MKNLIARIRVILTAAPTYLIAAGVMVAAVSDEVSKLLPAGWQDNAAQLTGAALGILGAAVAIIRRVVPVFPEDRGILPYSPCPLPHNK